MEISGNCMKLSISLIVLTYNEEENIEDCLKSVDGIVEDIFVVDSYSTDKTLQIAEKYTRKIYQHPFETQAKQFNWALGNLSISTEWIIRLDADERVTPELCDELRERLPQIPEWVIGLYVKRRAYFMGRWVRHGGYYPTWLLRIFRRGKARCEQRRMDEHIVVSEGKTENLENDIIHDNHKGISIWIEKHNKYATREMMEINDLLEGKGDRIIHPHLLGDSVQRKRWFRENLYLRTPLFLRSFLYFIYRYFFRLGFLDGKEGLIFHFLQAFWYRFLVDAKIYEYRKGLN
jgi:glycosyltransferase involved in cell wall biosynthesis